MNSRLRFLCSKIHLYVGLVLGLVVIVVSLTGSALVYRVEIDRMLNPDLLEVAPPENPASLGAVVSAAQQAVPDDRLRLVRFPRSPEAPFEIWTADDDHVFVDPGTAEVLGVRGYHEGAMNTLFHLHSTLLGGETGEQIVGITALLMLVLALTGVVLWWPALTVRWRRIRAGLVIVWRRGPWRLNYDLHRTGGFYTALFLVLLAGTGAAIIYSSQAGALFNAVTGSAPLPPPPTVETGLTAAPPIVTAPLDAAPVDATQPNATQPDAALLDAALLDAALLDATLLDEALETAHREIPDAVISFISLPQTPDAPLTVRMRTPSEWHPNGRSYVYFHPVTGAVLQKVDMREGPLGAKLLHAAYPLHIGSIGGAVVRFLYLVFGLAPAVLAVTGTLIWYRRWRKQHRRMDGGMNGTPERRRAVRPVAPDIGLSTVAD